LENDYRNLLIYSSIFVIDTCARVSCHDVIASSQVSLAQNLLLFGFGFGFSVLGLALFSATVCQDLLVGNCHQ